MALAVEECRHPEIDANRLCVSDVDISVRFRREARNDLASRLSGGDALFDPLAQKMPARICFFHGFFAHWQPSFNLSFYSTS
jgi:hypothetical protein